MTTLEAFSVCRLAVTAPSLQSVVALAAGFYRRLNIADAPVVDGVDAYVTRARELAADAAKRGALEAAVCRADGKLFNDDESVAEWAAFLRRASSGAAPAPFSNTGSTTVSGISLAAASTPAAQAVLQDAIWRVAGGTDVEILSVTAAARGSGIDVSYRITSPDLAASRDVAERLADVAADPALFDRAVAEAARAAS